MTSFEKGQPGEERDHAEARLIIGELREALDEIADLPDPINARASWGTLKTPKRYDPRQPYTEAIDAEGLFMAGCRHWEVKAIIDQERQAHAALAKRLRLPKGWRATWKPPWSHVGDRPACGAKTRRGTSCRNTSIYTNGRCKNHGGLSTGPKTPAGRARALSNLKHYRGNAKADVEKEFNFDELEEFQLPEFDLELTGLTDEGPETRAQRREVRETIKMLRS